MSTSKRNLLTQSEKKMVQLEKIRNDLKDRNVQAVARATGIHANAIYKIMRGTTNPKYETVRKLAEYLEGNNG
jgi:DNA-binding phage protein